MNENHLTSDNETKEISFLFVADDAFPLNVNIMKPHALRHLDDRKRLFNYRSSRTRRVTENAFGILLNRFRVFTSEILSVVSISNSKNHHPSKHAQMIRDTLADQLIGEGKIP